MAGAIVQQRTEIFPPFPLLNHADNLNTNNQVYFSKLCMQLKTDNLCVIPKFLSKDWDTFATFCATQAEEGLKENISDYRLFTDDML